jgi:hypothetical protein
MLPPLVEAMDGVERSGIAIETPTVRGCIATPSKLNYIDSCNSLILPINEYNLNGDSFDLKISSFKI